MIFALGKNHRFLGGARAAMVAHAGCAGSLHRRNPPASPHWLVPLRSHASPREPCSRAPPCWFTPPKKLARAVTGSLLARLPPDPHRRESSPAQSPATLARAAAGALLVRLLADPRHRGASPTPSRELARATTGALLACLPACPCRRGSLLARATARALLTRLRTGPHRRVAVKAAPPPVALAVRPLPRRRLAASLPTSPSLPRPALVVRVREKRRFGRRKKMS